MSKTIYITESQFLREFGEDNEVTTMAVPDSKTKDIASTVNKSKTSVPNATNVMVDPSMYDSSKSNDAVQVDVDASNGMDAQQKINTMLNNNPPLKSMANKGNLLANVHMENKVFSKKQIQEQRLNYIRNNSYTISKSNLDKIFLQ